MSRRPVTIREVARLAGVSVATVSNVLNGRVRVKPGTRALVEAAMRDLDFTPDGVARSLISGRRRSATRPAAPRLQGRLAAAGLPPVDRVSEDLISQVLDEGARGATRHVRLAHRLLARLAEADAEGAAVRIAAELIQETRGREAPLVANAVAWLLQGSSALPAAERAATLSARAEAWSRRSAERLAGLINAATALLGPGARPVLLDYSSTVAAVVEGLHARGLSPSPVLLECRPTGGGLRYLHAFAPLNLPLDFLPDIAVEHALGQGSAVLIGCESIRPDGAVLNVAGSLPLARSAVARDVPVYVCADLFKLDLEDGGEPFPGASASYDVIELDGLRQPGGRAVQTAFPRVERVPPALISRIVTEAGATEPSAVAALGRALLPPLLSGCGQAPPVVPGADSE